MNRRTEGVLLAAAALLFWGGQWARSQRGLGLVLNRPEVFLPGGLLFLAVANVYVRSKIVAWGVFTGAIVLGMIVIGAGAVNFRLPASSLALTVNSLAAATLYALLATTAAFQLRVR